MRSELLLLTILGFYETVGHLSGRRKPHHRAEDHARSRFEDTSVHEFLITVRVPVSLPTASDDIFLP